MDTSRDAVMRLASENAIEGGEGTHLGEMHSRSAATLIALLDEREQHKAVLQEAADLIAEIGPTVSKADRERWQACMARIAGLNQ